MTSSTVRSIKCALHEKRAASPRSCCHSPSSISDVDFGRRAMDNPSVANDKLQVHVRRDAELGDELEHPEASTGSRALASGSVDINEVLAHRVSSSSSLKRQAAVDEDHDQATGDDPPRKKMKSDHDLLTVSPEAADSDYLPSDYDEGDSLECAVSRGYDYDYTADGGCESVELNVTADVACSSESTRRRSRRTLYIEYWSRTDECKERKWDHLDEIADKYGSAEEHIFATTLKGRTACLEPNMFPYDTPAGIEHWTLWHVNDLNHEQVKQYVENWIDANAPHVMRWNYDDNPERSIDIFHVHVYLQVAGESTVLQERKVDDLVHELD